MFFTINDNLAIIRSIQFINSILNKPVKNLSENEFKYLSQELRGDFLELVKQIRSLYI